MSKSNFNNLVQPIKDYASLVALKNAGQAGDGIYVTDDGSIFSIVGTAITGTAATIDTLAEIPSASGTYKVGSQLLVVGEDGKKNYVKSSNFNDTFSDYYADIAPTHFFDPSASNSSGAGTSANPFTTIAQIQAWVGSLSGNMAGKVLQWKDNTTLYAPGGAIIDGVYGSESSPFIICRSYDGANKPMITGLTPVTNFTNYANDKRVWYVTSAYNNDLIDTRGESNWLNWHRYPKVADVATLQAKGAGFATYVGTTLYFIPIDGGNPNSGNVNITYNGATGHKDLLSIRYKNIANTGNITVAGIKAVGASNTAIRLSPSSTTTNISSIGYLNFIDCEAGFSGIDSPTGNSYDDAILAEGVSDSLRATINVIGCRTHNSMNNAIEMNNCILGEVAYNYATMHGGTFIEFYHCVSNVKVHHNYSSGLRGETYAMTGGYFANSGIWIPGYTTGTTVDTSGTKNVNNTFAFNFLENMVASGANVGPVGVTFTNNTIRGGYLTGTSLLRIIGAGYPCSVNITNNILWGNDASGYEVIRSTGAADVITGDNNIICRSNGTIANCTFRNTSAAFATFVTNVQAVTAGALATSINKFPLLSSGFPDYGSPAINAGKSVSGYGVDLAGETISGNHIGAYQPKRKF